LLERSASVNSKALIRRIFFSAIKLQQTTNLHYLLSNRPIKSKQN